VDFLDLRKNMVESQIRTCKVSDKHIIQSFLKIPRELFAPPLKRDSCYMDREIKIARNRYLMEPMVFARLVQASKLSRKDSVLDIACGTGYSTAVLALLANDVIGLERRSDLVEIAEKNLSDLSIDNAITVKGSLRKGYQAQAPYDVIFVEGSVDFVPKDLLDQLNIGGRLLTITNSNFKNFGQAVLYLRTKTSVSKRLLFEANIARLPSFEKKNTFKFF
jgi:protein-L-isoaspartate(D-aspartate) O-methyltransferase|tara:strand:+ start:90 stop:749 length:660 start_codon:yes stop_codon:yes gene_type:complete